MHVQEENSRATRNECKYSSGVKKFTVYYSKHRQKEITRLSAVWFINGIIKTCIGNGCTCRNKCVGLISVCSSQHFILKKLT